MSKRIHVLPERLRTLGADLGQAGSELAQLRAVISAAASALEWEVRAAGNVDDEVQAAHQLAGALTDTAERLSHWLRAKAEAFHQADATGTTLADPTLEQEMSAIRRRLREAGRTPHVKHDEARQILGLGALTGAGATAIPVLRRPGQAARQDPGATPAPVSAPVSGDAFWDRLAQPPLVTDENGLHFSPQFEKWAGEFNARIRANWADETTDHAGTTGADRLVETYLLTPAKVAQIWSTARENHVDPRLLLAILQQEGTGSFNTNPVNSEEFHGHGPQPDFASDLKAALDGPICGKLRLYGAAVKAGFPGTWVDWVNWYTPMDTDGMKGAPGVYAADINWRNGVSDIYRDVAVAVGGGSGDPVGDYSKWMGEHSDLFKPRHIEGGFVIRQGVPPGMAKPPLALHGSAPQPTPGAVLEKGWWWFEAEDRYYWYLERQ